MSKRHRILASGFVRQQNATSKTNHELRDTVQDVHWHLSVRSTDPRRQIAYALELLENAMRRHHIRPDKSAKRVVLP